jgi:hypothetical protein
MRHVRNAGEWVGIWHEKQAETINHRFLASCIVTLRSHKESLIRSIFVVTTLQCSAPRC